LLRGENLRERLDRCERLSPDQVLPLAEQVASGLGAAHRAGVVHRDFKSSNVMLVAEHGEERAVVTDFGLAIRAPIGRPGTTSQEPAPSEATIAMLGSIAPGLTPADCTIGTPDYMAPEQINGEEA